MVDGGVHVTMGENDRQPKNRKDVYLMWEKTLTQVSVTGNQKAIIDCLTNGMINALADIPEDKYEQEDIWKCEPIYKNVKKQFFKDHNIIVPEMEMALQNHINREYYMIWKKRLYKQKRKIIGLLKTYTKWNFDQEETTKVEF